MTRVKALMVGACLGLSIPAASQAAAAPPVAVERGDHYGTRIFPDNAFTVADSSQVTGRRVNFRQGVDFPSVGGVILAACTTADYSICDAFSQLNKLDGFDLQQRVTVPFTQNGINDEFLAASVPPSVNNPISGIERTNQVNVDPTAPGAFQSSAAPNLIPPGAAGYYAFGSFLSPRYQFASASGHQDDPYGVSGGLTDGEIPPVPTTMTPKPFGADRLGVIAVTPNPALFPPPWPAAIYGPGFTRSDYDLFVTADYNASRGIVTLSTDPSGHCFGPLRTPSVPSNGASTTFLSYGRGRDLNGDGIIGDGLNDGVGPTGHYQPDGSELPTRKPIDGLESGLVQTTVDNMALGRALVAGLDIPGVGTNLVNPSKIMYYGLSFGGIYGTMLMGTDPLVHQGLLNVPGGPIVDIARLSSFRGDLAAALSISRPSYLNGGPGLSGFTEDLPLRTDPAEVITHPGAAALQELFAATNWYDRKGSPETFAPRIRLRPDSAWASNPKNVVFQSA